MEWDTTLMRGQQCGARRAKTPGTARSAQHLSHEKYPDADEQQHRKPGQQDRQEAWHAAVFRAGDDAHVIGIKDRNHIGAFRHDRRDDAPVLRGAFQITSFDNHLDNLLPLDLGNEVGLGQLASRCGRG